MYLLEVKNEATRNWSESLKRTVSNKRKHFGKGRKSEYIPKYLTYQNEEKEIVRNSAKLEIFLNRKHLVFNEDGMKTGSIQLGEDMSRNSIYDLRAAIYQIGDTNQELREIKIQMIQTLVVAERKLLRDFLNWFPRYEEISAN